MDRVIEYNYDNLSRLITETWIAADGVTVENTISYTYDAWGRLDIIEDESSKYDYDYDNLDRVTSVDNNGNATGVPRTVLTNTYDLVGRRTSLAAGDPGGLADFINTYSYDAAGRMTRLTQAGQAGGRTVAEKRVDLAYDNLGRIDTIARYEDLLGTEHVATSDYNFDLAGRLITLAHTAGAASLASYNYTYDRLGRLTQETSVDGTKNYSYDEIGQLTGVTGAANENYAYDATGNRTGGTVIGTNNRLLDDGTHAYLYDDNGNRIRRTNKATGDYEEYAWDHRNRLIAVTFHAAGGSVARIIEYHYDVFDRLIARYDNTDGLGAFEEEEFYIHDSAPGKGGLDDIVLTYDENGDVVHRYLHGPGVDQVFSDESFIDGLLWALADRQGSVRDWVDYDEATDTTSVYNHVEYDSFGTIISQSNPGHEVTIAFTGRYLDPVTGLMWYRGRWYDPRTGRFVSEDPIGFGGWDVNLGRYVGNGPTNWVDPSGLAPWIPRAADGNGQYWIPGTPLPVDDGYERVAVYDSSCDEELASNFVEGTDEFRFAYGAENFVGLVEALREHVKWYGKIDALYIVDHGGGFPGHQRFGQPSRPGMAQPGITPEMFEEIRPFLGPDPVIVLTGCSVGGFESYCQDVANTTRADVIAGKGLCQWPWWIPFDSDAIDFWSEGGWQVYSPSGREPHYLPADLGLWTTSNSSTKKIKK